MKQVCQEATLISRCDPRFAWMDNRLGSCFQERVYSPLVEMVSEEITFGVGRVLPQSREAINQNVRSFLGGNQ